MPHLVKWQEELSDFGLIIIGPHVQQGTDAEIKAQALKSRINFAVVKSGSVQGANFNAIPHCFLFGADGKCLFEGHPGEVEHKLRVAVGQALAEKVGLAKPAPAVATLLESLKKGHSPTSVIQKIAPLL